MGEIRTTVIVPNYNGLEYLKKCIASLEKQTVPVRIIVVDNASGDGSVEYIRSIAAEHDHILGLYSGENEGFSAAVNKGILASDTDYVFLLNNDTEAMEDCVEKLQEFMDDNDEYFSAQALMLSMGDPRVVDGAGDYYTLFGWAVAAGKGKRIPGTGSNGIKAADIFSSCAGAAVYRRDQLKDIGLFDESHFAYLEDVDVGYRSRLRGYRNRLVPEAVVLHAGSASSGSRHNKFKVGLASGNNIYLIYKNMPFLQLLLNSPFLLAGMVIKAVFFTLKGMGGAYFEGIARGMRLCREDAGRRRNMGLRGADTGIFFRIEVELIANIPRIFLK